MRERKYRFWDKQDKKMIYPEDAINSKDVFAIGLHGLPIAVDEYSFKIDQGDEVTAWNIEHRMIPMDYIGVKDCNGLDIYESDIVRIEHTSLLIPANTIGVVSYASARYVIDTHAHTHGLNMFVDRRYRRYGKPVIEVIGNVWEHPGLAPKK